MAEFNKNMLSPVGFSFNIKKSPALNFFVTSVNVPAINLGFYEQPTPFKKIPVYGDHLEYEELTVSFKVNEDLSNYIELWDWLQGLGFPEEYGQFKKLSDNPSFTGNGIVSDANLMILSSSMNPIVRLDFEDLFPVSLSALEFNSADTGIDYISCTAGFKFTKYNFVKL